MKSTMETSTPTAAATTEVTKRPNVSSPRTANTCSSLRPLAAPLPRIPDCEDIKPESYNYQEFVVSGRIVGQSNEIETKEDYGYDDVCPAIQRIVQCQ